MVSRLYQAYIIGLILAVSGQRGAAVAGVRLLRGVQRSGIAVVVSIDEAGGRRERLGHRRRLIPIIERVDEIIAAPGACYRYQWRCVDNFRALVPGEPLWSTVPPRS